MTAPLRLRIDEDMKAALRAKEKRKLDAVRLIIAALKQVEIDERITLDETRIFAILDKMVKQRRDSVSQYEAAGRADLAEQEAYEISIIQTYVPQALSAEEVAALVSEAITESGVTTLKDMGKVMALLKPKLQGRADMAIVSQHIKTRLSGA